MSFFVGINCIAWVFTGTHEAVPCALVGHWIIPLASLLHRGLSVGRNLIAGYSADLTKLVVKGTEAQAKRYADLNRAAQALNERIQSFSTQRRTFLTMQDEVRNMRATSC